MADRLSTSLQESILTLLAVNDKQGRIASGLLTAASFDDSYRDIAARVIDFQRTQGKAPGKAHLDDLLDDVLGNQKHKKHKQYIHILQGIVAQEDGLNPDYLLTRISEFSRRQQLKGAILEAGELYQQGGDDLVPNVEALLYKSLRAQEQGMDAGTFLNDKSRALAFLDRTANNYSMGVQAFDRVGLGPTPGKILLFIGAKGIGKSWACVDISKRCLMQGAKVLHVSLEMTEDEVSQRYFQNFFALPQRSEPYEVTEFTLDKLGRLTALDKRSHKPRHSLDEGRVRQYLEGRIKAFNKRFRNLAIKEFATSSLTVPKLEAYLDYLELAKNFIPHVLVLDYPDLMQLRGDDIRVAIGTTFKDLRGMLKKRNLAGVFPTQSSRLGWDAKTVTASMVAEDSSKIMTADQTIIYSQTAAEKARGLARLAVAHNRGGEDKFTVLVSQSYKTGQFVLDSWRMHGKQYWDLVGDQVVEDDQA